MAASDAEAAAPRCFLDLPEDVLRDVMHKITTPLAPQISVGFAACCCKAIAAMPLLRDATARLKKERARAFALATKGGTTLARLGGASRLSWIGKELSDADVTLLAGLGEWLPRLEELDLRKNAIGDKGLAALAAASARGKWAELRVLGLASNRVAAAGAAALVAPPHAAFRGLEQLSLTHNRIDAKGMAALASGLAEGALPALQTCYLTGNAADDAAVQAALHVPSAARAAAQPLGGGGYLGGVCGLRGGGGGVMYRCLESGSDV